MVTLRAAEYNPQGAHGRGKMSGLVPVDPTSGTPIRNFSAYDANGNIVNFLKHAIRFICSRRRFSGILQPQPRNEGSAVEIGEWPVTAEYKIQHHENNMFRGMLMTVLLMFGQLARSDLAGPVTRHILDRHASFDGRKNGLCVLERGCRGTKFHYIFLEKTEVRFAYDGTYLYVSGVSANPPRTSLPPSADRPEKRRNVRQRLPRSSFTRGVPARTGIRIFASPPGSRWHHYILEPDWQRRAAARFDGGWTLEERIPFDEFAQPKQFFATPQTGEAAALCYT